MKTRFTMLLIFMLAGCQPEQVFTRVPFEESDRSAVVIVEQGSVRRAFSIDATMREARPLLDSLGDVSDARPVRIYAVFYDRSIEPEGLAFGELTLASSGLDLPGRRTRAVQTLIDGEQSTWEPVADSPLPEALSALRFEGEAPCIPFDIAAEAPVPQSAGFPVALLPWDDADALLITRDFEQTNLFTLEGDTLVPLGQPIDFHVQDALRAEDGQIWLLGGRLQRGAGILVGDPVSGFQQRIEDPELRRAEWPLRSTFGTGDDASSVYAVSESGGLVRYSEGQENFEVLVPFDFQAFGAEPALRATGASSLLFTDAVGGRFQRFSQGDLQPVSTAIDEGLQSGIDRILTLVDVEGFGRFAGTLSGTVLIEQDGFWDIFIEPVLINSAIRAIVPYGRGVLFAGRYGAIQQYQPGVELCEENLFLGNDLVITRAVASQVSGGTLVLLGRRQVEGAADPWAVTTIRQR